MDNAQLIGKIVGYMDAYASAHREDAANYCNKALAVPAGTEGREVLREQRLKELWSKSQCELTEARCIAYVEGILDALNSTRSEGL